VGRRTHSTRGNATFADKGPDMDDACEVGLAAWELCGCRIGPQRPLRIRSSRGLPILSLSRY